MICCENPQKQNKNEHLLFTLNVSQSHSISNHCKPRLTNVILYVKYSIYYSYRSLTAVIHKVHKYLLFTMLLKKITPHLYTQKKTALHTKWKTLYTSLQCLTSGGFSCWLWSINTFHILWQRCTEERYKLKETSKSVTAGEVGSVQP